MVTFVIICLYQQQCYTKSYILTGNQKIITNLLTNQEEFPMPTQFHARFCFVRVCVSYVYCRNSNHGEAEEFASSEQEAILRVPSSNFLKLAQSKVNIRDTEDYHKCIGPQFKQ